MTTRTLYAGLAGGGAVVFKSTDGGGNWTGTALTNNRISALAIDPQTPTTVYAAGFGLFKSADGGGTWIDVRLPSLNVWALAIDPVTPTTLYAGVTGGVLKSTDGGGTWSSTGLASSVVALAIDPGTPSTLYAGTAGDGIFKSTNRGATWSPLNTGLTTLFINALAIDPQTPTTVYAATRHGVFVLQQTSSEITTVTFDTPAPECWDGIFQGIDFGSGQWQISGPYNVNPTNHIYFADSTGTSRSFQFTSAPRVLRGMRVYSTTPGTLTLSDDTGQTFTRPVSTGSLQLVTTGWTRPATTVTVSFTNGWDLGVDDITYGTAP